MFLCTGSDAAVRSLQVESDSRRSAWWSIYRSTFSVVKLTMTKRRVEDRRASSTCCLHHVTSPNDSQVLLCAASLPPRLPSRWRGFVAALPLRWRRKLFSNSVATITTMATVWCTSGLHNCSVVDACYYMPWRHSLTSVYNYVTTCIVRGYAYAHTLADCAFHCENNVWSHYIGCYFCIV